MKTARGFAIVDLVLLAIIVPAVVVATLCLGPILPTTRERARRTTCAANLNALGKAFCMYNGQNSDRWPWMVGKDWDTTPTGKNREVTDNSETQRSVTALPFMLVRTTDQSMSLFVCPSDMSATTDTMPKNANSEYYWDFSSDRNMSYSYASPMVGGKQGIINGTSNQYLVVMADKTPAYDGGKADTDWSKPDKLTPAQKAASMSQNHQGEYVNLLFIDCHVAPNQTPVEPWSGDNIYSASGTDDISLFGTIGMANHKSYQETYLIGPISDKKATSGPATSLPATKPSGTVSSYSAD